MSWQQLDLACGAENSEGRGFSQTPEKHTKIFEWQLLQPLRKRSNNCFSFSKISLTLCMTHQPYFAIFQMGKLRQNKIKPFNTQISAGQTSWSPNDIVKLIWRRMNNLFSRFFSPPVAEINQLWPTSHIFSLVSFQVFFTQKNFPS